MAPIFTTPDNVAFDFGTNIISAPNSISSIDSQWLVDHCRLAEESVTGLSRPSIVAGSGKITIDTDANGNPIRTGVVAILNNWKINTQKTSGNFTIKDIYRSDGGIPYVEPSPVPVRYQQTVGGVILQDTGNGGGGATPAQIWNYNDRTLTTDRGLTLTEIEASNVLAKQVGLNTLLNRLTETRVSKLDRDLAHAGDANTYKADVSGVPSAVDNVLTDNFAAILAAISLLPNTASIADLKLLLEEIYLLHGLKFGSPLTVTDTQRIVGTITQIISSGTNQTTVTRI